MIKAVKKDERLIDEILEASSNDLLIHLWWFGQSGFLVKWNEYYLLIDPYLSDSLTHKYRDTDKPHVRMTELVVQPEKLNFINIVTSSHNHTDHLDGETLVPLLKVNPELKVIVPTANLAFAANRLNVSKDRLIGINDGEELKLEKDISITAIPAAHNDIERDEAGNSKFLGYIFSIGPFKIYHSGDTLWYDELEELLPPFKIDLALLPINGNKPERRVAGNLNAREAVLLGKKIKAVKVIPCHYHMFEFNTVEPDEFIKFAARENQEVVLLQCGERYSYEK